MWSTSLQFGSVWCHTDYKAKHIYVFVFSFCIKLLLKNMINLAIQMLWHWLYLCIYNWQSETLLLFLLFRPSKTFLGRLPEKDIYLDIKRYTKVWIFSFYMHYSKYSKLQLSDTHMTRWYNQYCRINWRTY